MLLEDAERRENQAACDSENLAMLVDRDDYWLTSEYMQWTADPDDEEVKRAVAQRKRKNIKPPPTPLLPPIARRPSEESLRLLVAYIKARDEADKPAPRMSVAEYNRRRGVEPLPERG